MALGDTVGFIIIVENQKHPNPPDIVVDWYQVQATDVVSSVLEIDTVSSGILGYQGEEPVMQITDNTVVVTVDLLRPGDYIVLRIVCTAVGPLQTGMVIVNQATMDYEDNEGNARETIYSDPVMIPVDYYRRFLPIVATSPSRPPPLVPESSTLLLMTGGAAGLATYLGRQFRARRRAETGKP